MKKEDLHGKLSEQKSEYLRKMKIIDEIKRDKLRQEEQEQLLKDQLHQKRAEEQKFLAQNFKDMRHIDKLKA